MINHVCLEINFNFESEDICKKIHDALLVETKINLNDRAKTFIERDLAHLILKIDAIDTISARAAANSYLKWINLSLELLKQN